MTSIDHLTGLDIVSARTNMYAMIKHEEKVYRVLVVDTRRDWVYAFRWLFNEEPTKSNLIGYEPRQ